MPNAIQFYNDNTLSLSLASTGAATFSSSVTAGGALRVSGGSTFTNGELEFTSTTSGGQLGIFSNQGTSTTLFFDHRATGNTGNFSFRNGSGGANTLMYIAGSGNVGIGTSSPSVASGLGLVLNGGAAQTRLAFKNTFTGDSSGDGVQFALINGSSGFVFQNRESDGYFSFETNGTERLNIASTGAATFSGALSGTSASFTGNVTVGGSSENLFIANGNSFSGVRLSRGGVAKWAIFNNNAGTDFFDVYNYSTSSSAFTLASTGAATFSSSITAGAGLASGNTLVLSNGTNSRQLQVGYSTGAGYNYLQVYDGSSFQPLVLNNALT
ncbi:MAG: hypothetical protein ACOVOV_14985, partial [Dolichospermum sp.]